jgi:hypothetical protein
MSTVGGVGVAIHGSGTDRLRIPLQSGRPISRDIFALYTPDLTSRSSHGISRLLSVSWLQQHCNCEISFPTGTDIGTLTFPTCMGVFKPSGNGLYTLPHLSPVPHPSP